MSAQNIQTEVEPLLLTEKDACKMIGVRSTTLYQLRKTGKIKSVSVRTSRHSVRGRRLYSVESLKAYVDSLLAVAGEETAA